MASSAARPAPCSRRPTRAATRPLAPARPTASPTAEGGALRSQSIRRVEGTSAAVLNGALLRIDPNTGYGVSSNPFYTGNGNNNQSRILAFGLRNPFRFTFQPNKSTVWIGDVGDGTWEEVDKLPMAATASERRLRLAVQRGRRRAPRLADRHQRCARR